MVLFFDLEDEACDPQGRSHDSRGPVSIGRDDQLSTTRGISHSLQRMTAEEFVPAMASNWLAVALTCYPIALSLSSHLDLNDLDALSTTCRSVHRSLTQFVRQLKAHSLRCSHDDEPLLTDILAAMTDGQDVEAPQSLDGGSHTFPRLHSQVTAAVESWPYSRLHQSRSFGHLTKKISSCARDLVAPCRKCGTVVCRNCAAKSPSNAWLRDRHRRLCKTCLEAPLLAHLQPLTHTQEANDGPPRSSSSSIRSERSFSGSSSSSCRVPLDEPEPEPELDPSRLFTASCFLRDSCTCASRGVFLCAPCGQNLRAHDTTYKRVWTWRSRYSTHIGGGLGTGLGVGNQGQKCGREEHCLEMGPQAVCWVEIDCSEGKASDQPDHERPSSSRAGTPDYINTPGYYQQEIEGIGGVVKKKVKKRVKVGAPVWEFEDERDSGRYLERECNGQERSWCGWCDRLCLGEKDLQPPM